MNDRERVQRSFLTVTTRDPDTPLEAFREGFAAVTKRLRRHYGVAEYYGTIEQTTGWKAADGRRRTHGHYLVKATIPDVGQAETLVRDTWERSTLNSLGESGRSYRVTLEPVSSLEAVSFYLGSYFGKVEQIPDADWGGRRVRVSQRFFPEGRVRARERAYGELIGRVKAKKEGIALDDPLMALYEAVEAESRLLALDRAKERKRLRAELAELVGFVAHDAADRLDRVDHCQLSFTDVASENVRDR